MIAVVSLDCERVRTNRGSETAWICIIDEECRICFKSFVKPRGEVKDHLTWVSGVKPRDLINAPFLEEIRPHIQRLLDGRLVVGHSVQTDLKFLAIDHPKNKICDISRFPRFRTIEGRSRKLKSLALEFLGSAIQNGAHDPEEDARAAMKLYTKFCKYSGRHPSPGSGAASSSSSTGGTFSESGSLGYCGLGEEGAPKPACCYCGVNEPAAIAKCVESRKWFCNVAGNSSGSHIVQHLVCSNHNQVQLHPESPLGEERLECYNCGGHNVFLLGYRPVINNILLCRECVATDAVLREMGVNLADWRPLIQDRCFLAWVVKVKVPRKQQELCAQQVTGEQITKLEALWKIDPDATLEQAAAP